MTTTTTTTNSRRFGAQGATRRDDDLGTPHPDGRRAGGAARRGLGLRRGKRRARLRELHRRAYAGEDRAVEGAARGLRARREPDRRPLHLLRLAPRTRGAPLPQAARRSRIGDPPAAEPPPRLRSGVSGWLARGFRGATRRRARAGRLAGVAWLPRTWRRS